MTATKAGGSIYVTGSPNTLSSITSDINDITWIEESPAGTFTVKAKHLVARDGGVITIGDSGDYSVAEKLVMQPSANTNCRLDIDRGGEVQLFGASEIDANSQTPSFYQRWRWYGKFYCRGNATYTPYIYHLYLIWVYRTSFSGDGFDRNHDVMDIDYLKVDTPWSAAAKMIQASSGRVFADYNVEKIKHLTVGKSGDAAVKVFETTQAQSRQCGDDYSKILWEDCIFQYLSSAFYLNPYHVHLKNCQFLQMTGHAMTIYSPFTVPGIGNTENVLYRDMTQKQLYVFLEGCTFTPVYVYDISVQWGGALLVKDCTFNAATRNLTTTDGGRIYVWSGNTFNATTPIYRAGANTQIFWVFALSLTIQDSGGSPLEGATIYVRQKDGKESFTFTTGADGKPLNMAALEGKIILAHKEQIDSVPNFTLWSDTGNSTYHNVWIFKEGYEPAKYDFVMSQDRSQVIQLNDALVNNQVELNIPFAFGGLGNLDSPAIGDVEKGVTYKHTSLTGTFKKPAVGDVRDGEGYGAGDVEFEGLLDLPAIGDVEKGVQFDQTTKTGTFKKPAVGDVRKAVGYGAGDNEFVGTAAIPGKADVREGVDVDVSDVGLLDLPVIADVEKGVQFDATTKTGTFKAAAVGDVRLGVGYGAGDTEFVGTAAIPGKADVRIAVDVDVSDVGLLDLPAIGDVEKDVQFDNLTKTGTFKVPTEVQVEKDVLYGAAGTEFTGSMVRRVVWKSEAIGKLQQRVSIKGIFQEGG